MTGRHCPTATPDPAGTGLEAAGDGLMWLDGRFRSPLYRARLLGFQSVMRCQAGRRIRALADRESWYLILHDVQRPPCGAYLKKHHVRTWLSWLRALIGIGPGESAGRTEARNVRAVAGCGVDVMDLVAYGEQLHADGRLESFVLTEELTGYTPLDEFLRERFSPLWWHDGSRRDPDLDRLIRQIAAVARRFHRAGFNHRDFYCCHFFVREPERGQFEIKLIDLQRVQHRRRRRRRWLVKDLAQLAWSAPADRIGCTRRLAFIRHYLGVEKLGPAEKRLIREVLAKQSVMQRRLGAVR